MRSVQSLVATCLLIASVAVPKNCLAAAPDPDSDKARKGIFLSEPLSVQYWLELARNKQKSRVSNKFSFKSGDQIRFHVKPSINGYAYIILRGKTGEIALFPAPESDANKENKVYRNQWVTVPNHGAFQFDNEPGIERVEFIVSREEIDPHSVFHKQADHSEKPADSGTSKNSDKPASTMTPRVAMSGKSGKTRLQNVPLIALMPEGDKDLVPSHVYIVYNDTPSNTPRFNARPAEEATKGGPVTGADSAKQETVSKASKRHAVHKAAEAHKSKPTPRKVAHIITKPAPKQHSNHALNASDNLPADVKPVTDMGVVTIDSDDPNGVIAAEIALKHEQ